MYRMCFVWFLWFLFIQYVQSAFTISTGPALCGQPVTVVATVTDNGPLVGAHVTLTSNGNTFKGDTDSNGQFTTSFTYLDPAPYDIVGSFISGPATFATWQQTGLGSYQGTLPGDIVVTVTATKYSPLGIVDANYSDPATFKYPSPPSTQAIYYTADDPWEMSMNYPVEGLLLYMGSWDVSVPLTFTSPFNLISPISNDYPPMTDLDLDQSPWNLIGTFSGLLRFVGALTDLRVIVDPQNHPLDQDMTLAVAPLEGQVTASVTVSCCVPQTPTFQYTESLFVPNLWKWEPSITLAVGGVPVTGVQVDLTAIDTTTGTPQYPPFAACSATTNANGVAKCHLADSLPGRLKVTLNAQFTGAPCSYTSAAFSQELTVFGFPYLNTTDDGKYAFIVSNRTAARAHVGDKVVFSGSNWFNNNLFFDGDSRGNGDIPSLISAVIQGIGFGGYVKVDVTKPTCGGSFAWNKDLLKKDLPQLLPSHMGVLVADTISPYSALYSGEWRGIIVVKVGKYNKVLQTNQGYGVMEGVYCPTATTSGLPTDSTPEPNPIPPQSTTKKPTTHKPTTHKPTTHKPTTHKPTHKPTTTKKPTKKPTHKPNQ